jgi:asparagine synthase (glutamine-hydrolysing)
VCGIAGVLARAPIEEIGALGAALGRSLAHRGPDDAGTYTSPDGHLLLAHRRLSIIDCSPAGRQPMSTAERRHWISFNGEIYNHKALRRSLESDGVAFATESDTEVLLQLLVRRGPGALDTVRGMFALAWWDETRGTLVLARDRFGIKPLYVATVAGTVCFASEIRALVDSGLVPRQIDAAGIAAYLRWGSIPPPLTWIAGVESFLPGTWREWSRDGHSRCGQFADARALWGGQPAGSNPDEFRARVSDALHDSVRAHLVADVPVGVFLSGGIDSALLASIAREHAPAIRTYTISVADARLDEAADARAVAAALGTTHETLPIDAPDVARDWARIFAHLDQPTGDGVNTYYISRAVHESGVKAVLSGIGGDEMFGGYPSFHRLPSVMRFGPRAKRLAPLATMAAGITMGTAMRPRLRHLADHLDSPGEIYRALRGAVMPAEFSGIAGDRILNDAGAIDRVTGHERQWLRADHSETPEAATSRLEATMYMRSQLLRDADAMSMAHGLEIRVPFVDHQLARAVWPDLGNFRPLLQSKQLLRDELAGKVPAEVLTRRKRGFTLPFDTWMRGPLGDFVRASLADLEADRWVAAGVADRTWQAWAEGAAHWSRPWTLAVLGRFLRDA